MNIALIGYGKMGRMIEQIACSAGHKITAIIDPFAAENKGENCSKISKTIAEADFSNTDAAIEFTRPDEAVNNIIILSKMKIPAVIGTTGWLENMETVKKTVENDKSSLFWASKFSIGVNLFFQIAWYAAKLMNNFTEYDAAGFESHHNKKMDSPSGTAKILAEGVLSILDRKNKIVWETMNRKPEADELHFPSLRLGSVPGTHSLYFDSPADTIEITHTARNREGFAFGAVRAAQWLLSEKRTGVFTIDDMMIDLFRVCP
jgi:4-hydroxy-tetrahydrodipicolinate reductase